MKDRQAPQTVALPRIPVVSAVLHCLSMPVILCLRSGFGYAFLRPRSIVLALSWALALFTAYSLLEPGMWPKNAAFCHFGIAAVLLYGMHFIVAFVSELRGTATHDNNSGTPHTFRILRLAGVPPSPRFQRCWVLWAEPSFVAMAAITVRDELGTANLSTWLLLCAVALWLKEALNFWLQIRQAKRQRDAMEDAEHSLDGSHPQGEIPPPAASRKGKVARKRAP